MLYDILDSKRLDILPLLKEFKNDFYLAGDTGLALQIGHRDSYDFDFFGKQDIDTEKLFEKIKEVFSSHAILKTQEEKNTLSMLIDDSIRLSFFGYRYKLLKNLIEEPNLQLASIEDIGCMKLSSIISRASNKDYIDLYYILQNIKLPNLLNMAEEKFSDIDRNLILKSLVYFDDVDMDEIIFKHNKDVEFKEVKLFLEKIVKDESKI